MVSSFTANKSLEKPANGDDVDTWNVPVNADWDAIDASLGGVTSLNVTSVSATPVVLTVTQYRPPIVEISGTLTANVTYQFPSGVGGFWSVFNNSSGAFTITFASLGGGTAIVVPQGFTTAIICDGTNVGHFNTAPSTNSGGAFTPTDATGTGGTMGSPIGNYRTTPGICTVWGSFTMGSNSNNVGVTIGGLPLPVANVGSAAGLLGSVVFFGGGGTPSIQGVPSAGQPNGLFFNKNTATFTFVASGVGLWNSDIATYGVQFSGSYPI